MMRRKEDRVKDKELEDADGNAVASQVKQNTALRIKTIRNVESSHAFQAKYAVECIRTFQ